MERGIAMSNHEIENTIETKSSANLKNFLRSSALSKFITENPDCYDIPEVLEELMIKTLSFPHLEQSELTGSMARFAAGFGSMEKYQKGREGAKQIFEQLDESGDKTQYDTLRKIVTDLAEGDIDMDLCFNFETNFSLLDLQNHLKQQFKNNPSFQEEEKSIEINNKKLLINTFFVDINDKYQLTITHEPIVTNPNFKKITVGIAHISEGGLKKIIHIDMSRFPKTGIEGREQKRHGGRTIKSQDRCRLILNSDGCGITYQISDYARSALSGQESIENFGKDIAGTTELSLRALRIHLIHSSDNLPININYLSPFLNAKSLFSLRKRFQEFTVSDKSGATMKGMSLSLKELVLCFNYDPYITLQFLQDSGLYLLLPDLKNLSSKDWHDLYLSDWLNLSTEAGDFISTEKRSMGSLVENQKEYKSRGLTNGFTSVMRAIHEIGGKKNDFNLEEAFDSFVNGNSKKFNIEQITKDNSITALSLILGYFSGGLSEIEAHRIYDSSGNKNTKETHFRGILRELKLTSRVDKKLHKIKIRGGDKTVTLYTLRTSGFKTPFRNLDSILDFEWKDNREHSYLNRAKEYLASTAKDSDLVDSSLGMIFSSLESFGIQTLEGFRSFSSKDFSDLYKSNTATEKFSGKDFQNVCRTLQIICEDVLRYPQFYKNKN